MRAASAVVAWDQPLLQAVRDTKPGPTVVARALAIVHTAEYDAWTAYDPVAVGTQLGAALRRPPAEATPANKQRAISYAAYRALLDLFPAERPLFDAQMAALGYDPADASTDRTTPAGIGNVAAQAVIAFRHADGSNQLGDLHAPAYSDYTGYAPVNTPAQISDPNRWQPLKVTLQDGSVVTQSFTTPHWGLVKPFALTSGSQFRPPAPPAFGSAEYARQVAQVIDYSAHLTDQQKAIAEYWMDGPNSELPPGHWCIFADFIAQRDHHTLDDDVKMLFVLANAELDTSIAIWDAKRAYDFVRPVSAVHYAYAGQTIMAWGGPNQGTKPISGADWRPYQPIFVITPPFAEYVSGHSGFSAASAEVLKNFTGSDAFGFTTTIAAGSSRVEPGVTPATTLLFTYPTFSAAADEAGISRRYGGIHFEAGDLAARTLGRQVGAAVWAKAQSYITGHPAT
ncbi:MAG: vanadium-dependent haloperoxidase [Candidatus Velthaea sp.]